jgi:hypothetical protein
MESNQEKHGLKSPGEDKPEENKSETVAVPNVGDESAINNLKASDVVEDEVLRFRIRKLIDEPPPASTWKRLSANPLASVIVGFLLTGLIGGLLTNYYNIKQKELEAQRTKEQRESDRLREEQQRELDRKREDERRESDRLRAGQQQQSDQVYQERQKEIDFQRALQQRESERLRDVRQKELEYQRSVQQRELEREKSFADELNKIRVAKIGEVWETIYAMDSEIERYIHWIKELEKLNKVISQLKNTESLEKFRPRVEEQISKSSDRVANLAEKATDLTAKNRFWLGEENYTEIIGYIRASYEYAIAIAGSDKERQKEMYVLRNKARQSIINIRKKFLIE